MKPALALACVLAIGGAGAGQAQEKRVAPVQRTAAFFSALQEAAPVPAEEMAARIAAADADEKDEVAGEAALNAWKLCLYEALAHWAELPEGVGTLVDGAFGRCADLQTAYRARLQRITQDGRTIMDLNMARAMMRNLEDVWRPRLLAAALDQKLVALRAGSAR